MPQVSAEDLVDAYDNAILSTFRSMDLYDRKYSMIFGTYGRYPKDFYQGAFSTIAMA